MKSSLFITLFCAVLLVSSCDMDGANNPANSAESRDSTHTGLEMSGSPAEPVPVTAPDSTISDIDSTTIR